MSYRISVYPKTLISTPAAIHCNELSPCHKCYLTILLVEIESMDCLLYISYLIVLYILKISLFQTRGSYKNKLNYNYIK